MSWRREIFKENKKLIGVDDEENVRDEKEK